MSNCEIYLPLFCKITLSSFKKEKHNSWMFTVLPKDLFDRSTDLGTRENVLLIKLLLSLPLFLVLLFIS